MTSTLSQVFHYVCRGRWLVNEPSMLRQQRFEISRSVLTPTWRLDAICSSLQNDRIYLGFFFNERSTPQVTGKISAFPWKSRSEAPQHLQKFRYHICSSSELTFLESETFVKNGESLNSQKIVKNNEFTKFFGPNVVRLPKPRISKTIVKGLRAAKTSFRSKKRNSSFFSGLSRRVFLFVPWFEGFELDHFSMRFFPWVCASMRLVCAGKSRENKISWLFDNSFTRILAVQWFSMDKELRSGLMELYLPICGVLLFRFLT